jgi:hypothetical protein
VSRILIPLAPDVRRERHAADGLTSSLHCGLVQCLARRIQELHAPKSIGLTFLIRSTLQGADLKRGALHFETLTLAQLARRAHHSLPGTRVPTVHGTQEEELHLPAATAQSEDPRRSHARVVQNQEVAWFQDLRQITHVAVLGSILLYGMPQEARPIPGLHGLLGNGVGGQVKVVIAESHGG